MKTIKQITFMVLTTLMIASPAFAAELSTATDNSYEGIVQMVTKNILKRYPVITDLLKNQSAKYEPDNDLRSFNYIVREIEPFLRVLHREDLIPVKDFMAINVTVNLARTLGFTQVRTFMREKITPTKIVYVPIVIPITPKGIQ